MAEVLITLGIIGVVAALTIPSLIAKHQEKQTVVALKKFYSTISQAYSQAELEYGTPENWYDSGDSTDFLSSIKMGKNLTKYMKISKECLGVTGCFPAGVYSKIDGTNSLDIENHNGISRYLTADGMSIFFYSYNVLNIPGSNNSGTALFNHARGAITVDINGFKGPNMFGKDTFTFLLADGGIVPCGAQAANITDNEGTVWGAFEKTCNRKDCYGYCEGCAAWVIYNENLDYLHCDDLSWQGKHKCK